ncbi:radical SAM protein [Aquimarina sp. RZ0]|uniref:B12-binding domain-containing radical SAM protein n=1 Tax=Aquimarina sp. RZ0 TaxID=2607730 RepID=UPI0011F0FDB8|nr:B12-binding domain-containing radical SAM protein [Aquimarina sp. RZ0]KAA1243624.1 radical SAM protein [Aquimarina sp. RZ0]
MKDVLLITPPFTQLNTPYPATAYLKGFLNTKTYSSFQMDLGIEVILALFSKNGLTTLFEVAFRQNRMTTSNSQRIYALRATYLTTIDPIIKFLQGENQTFARQICSDQFLPKASRFEQLDDMEWAFGSMGLQDKAKHLATLYLEDLSDFIVECVDENFGFSRYAERLGRSANSFDELYNYLNTKPTYIDTITLRILEDRLQIEQPKLVCISVPFPGNLYSAFRCAQWIKKKYPTVKTAMGGGFPNTELRSITDIRVFDFFDYITLDDGELPVELLVSNIVAPTPSNQNYKTYKRTFFRENSEIIYSNSSSKKDYKQSEVGTPDYTDLLLDHYISVIEIANPMHSLWSDGRWNKLTMAHGCYWGKCTFCDISLDYIKIYEPVAAKLLADRVEQMIKQTGEKGFHFVDEAAPPALMRAFAIEIIKRKISISWWTNIRFEKSFTLDLCILLKASGCIAVSGGLEVASDRLLALIDKGVTVAQVARVTRNFTEAGIMVHSYLMYGYPTQTIQETIDSLEMVRQLFELGIIQSGFWHQFALTTHSPIGLNPSGYGIIPDYKDISFANNDVEFRDTTGIDHSKFSFGLKKSLFNYMHGICFELPLQNWFDFKIPKTTIKKDLIINYLQTEAVLLPKPSSKIVWLGTQPMISGTSQSKKGTSRTMVHLTFHTPEESNTIKIEKKKGEWLQHTLGKLSIAQNSTALTFGQLKSDFENSFDTFEVFWYSKPIDTLRDHGLLVL